MDFACRPTGEWLRQLHRQHRPPSGQENRWVERGQGGRFDTALLVDSGVVDQHTAFGHHLFQVTQAQRVGGVPATAHEHDLQRKMQTPDDPSGSSSQVGRAAVPWLHCGRSTIATEPLNRWPGLQLEEGHVLKGYVPAPRAGVQDPVVAKTSAAGGAMRQEGTPGPPELASINISRTFGLVAGGLLLASFGAGRPVLWSHGADASARAPPS